MSTQKPAAPTDFETAETCSNLQDLSRVMQGCTWRVQQQAQILKTAILAFYNDGRVPKPVAGEPLVKVQDELDARKDETVTLPSGAIVPTTEAALARELEQALRINSVHIHALMQLFQFTDALYEQVMEQLTENIKNLPKFTPPNAS
ncbi:hypothetical protein [Streptomyces sp. NPDC047985]|uniref:hypothetical protein n=1 Tax=Streptomyces sp. NPDC047985 TaxID=3155384 RepID=UPI003418C1E8